MSIRPITIATIAHFSASVIIWFILFGVVLGLGFKDDWSSYDYFYAYSVKTLFYVMCFPAWWAIESMGSSVASIWLLLVQLLSSFIQANVFLAVWGFVTGRNKKLQPTADAPAE